MQKLLQYIPGFRSGAWWKKTVASLYYIFTLLMLGAGFGTFLVFLSAPFLVFSIIDLVHKKKSAAIVLLVSLAFMITGIAIIPSPPDNQLAAEQPASQQPGNLPDNIAVTENNADFSDNSVTENVPKQSKNVEKAEETPNKQEEIDSTDTGLAKDEAKQQSQQNNQESSKNVESAVTALQPSEKPATNLRVHFIDVGQGDCILIENGSSAMLIDAGNPENGPGIVSYIKNLGIQKLNFVLATHPHADHIGGMADVINAFPVEKIIMPKVAHTTRTFENLLLTIQNKGLKITAPVPGTEYKLGDASFTILAPNSNSYEDLNNYSVVVKLNYGSTSFLFTGDAEATSENEILARGYNVKADVLKVGHHGSTSSTTDKFLDAVSPQYAVICVGAGNSYGHPAPATLLKLAERGIKIYRTDEAGTIVATSDGKSISFNKQPSSVNINSTTSKKTDNSRVAGDNNTNTASDDITVYITKTGTKYHRENCSSLRSSRIPISLSEAKQRGYEPCKICKPPQ